ncbi:hypothetical protein Tco_0953577 [Tanacetum coccineum]|uniref:Reverse transcriptase domain-containing protein n=1 Tax=Tanacetum coccineum TaxID=301880 RepID=A0ABQ5E0A6_9ASTR
MSVRLVLDRSFQYPVEEPSFLPVIISSQLSKEKKNKLVSILKKHKDAFAWKTTDIPGVRGGMPFGLCYASATFQWVHVAVIHDELMKKRKKNQVDVIHVDFVKVGKSKDRKGTENVAADHLSRIENNESNNDSEVDDNFPGETLMEINSKDEPCRLCKLLGR